MNEKESYEFGAKLAKIDIEAGKQPMCVLPVHFELFAQQMSDAGISARSGLLGDRLVAFTRGFYSELEKICEESLVSEGK